MFILIWVTLFFSVRGNKDGTASFPGGKQHCTQNDYCVTLTEGEISAETGLCVVLQCSFTTAADFNVQSVIWYKCEPLERKCVGTDTPIFDSSNSENVEPDFRGRVSLLESDLSHNNCSIIINDLKTSDSGSYKLRVGGTKRKKDGFTFESKATVTVTVLSKKPTVMVPPLTEGQQTTLTCTAPGLCSGSDPKITWTWRGAGEKDPHITGNITANQGRTSNLTFNPSAEHHGTEVTCKVSFRGNMTTEETVTLNVSYVKELKINGNTAVKMGDALNLTCSVDSFPASDITWTKSGSDKNLSEKDETEAQKHSGSASLIIHNMSAGDFGQYSCTAKHLNNTLTKTVDVTDAEKPVTIGTTTVRMVPLLTIAIISLIVNVAFIICFVFLWNSRKMVKPNEEDRTYMSLQKTDTSPVYDVIGQPLN